MAMLAYMTHESTKESFIKKDGHARIYHNRFHKRHLRVINATHVCAFRLRPFRALTAVQVLSLKTERDRREFFALKPCNHLTWPELARQYLVAVTQYRNCPGVTCADAIR